MIAREMPTTTARSTVSHVSGRPPWCSLDVGSLVQRQSGRLKLIIPVPELRVLFREGSCSAENTCARNGSMWDGHRASSAPPAVRVYQAPLRRARPSANILHLRYPGRPCRCTILTRMVRLETTLMHSAAPPKPQPATDTSAFSICLLRSCCGPIAEDIVYALQSVRTTQRSCWHQTTRLTKQCFATELPDFTARVTSQGLAHCVMKSPVRFQSPGR